MGLLLFSRAGHGRVMHMGLSAGLCVILFFVSVSDGKSMQYSFYGASQNKMERQQIFIFLIILWCASMICFLYIF
jgi:hypothetical protein